MATGDTMNFGEAHGLLDAYLDAELSIERSVEFESHLRECPSCQAELASRRALRSAMRDQIEYHMAPLSLRRALRNELDRAETPSVKSASAVRPMPQWMRMAASLILVAGLSSALTYYGTSQGGGVIPDEVFASHVRGVESQSRLVDVVSSDQHTVKPWLDARLDFAAPVKDLAKDGFPLIGGRVDYIAGHMVAALVYQSGKHFITLFVWPSEGSARSITASTRRGDSILHWSDGKMTYWAISDVEQPQLMDFAERFQTAGAL
jgi:anti-sigma factor RsiW